MIPGELAAYVYLLPIEKNTASVGESAGEYVLPSSTETKFLLIKLTGASLHHDLLLGILIYCKGLRTPSLLVMYRALTLSLVMVSSSARG
jgi:hypothetical protein